MAEDTHRNISSCAFPFLGLASVTPFAHLVAKHITLFPHWKIKLCLARHSLLLSETVQEIREQGKKDTAQQQSPTTTKPTASTPPGWKHAELKKLLLAAICNGPNEKSYLIHFQTHQRKSILLLSHKTKWEGNTWGRASVMNWQGYALGKLLNCEFR